MSDPSFQRDRLEELLFASAHESFSVEERLTIEPQRPGRDVEMA